MASSKQYIFFYGGTKTEWVTGQLASKVNNVAEASNRISGRRFEVTHHPEPKTAKDILLRTVMNSTPADKFKELKDFIRDHISEGWLVLTENGSVFEKGYGTSAVQTMEAFEKEWKNDVKRTKDFGQSFKAALSSRA